MNRPHLVFLLAAFLGVPTAVRADEGAALAAPAAPAPAASSAELDHRFSVDFSPLSPLFRIYAIHFGYRLTEHDEFIVGPSYMNIQYEFGHTNAGSLILGYRRYFWRGLHLEYQVWPTYDAFYEANEDKVYPSFDLWNEFRFGYRFDFELGPVPLYVNVQWPFGFGLYASNKPASFKAIEAKNRFFYFPPLLFLGARF